MLSMRTSAILSAPVALLLTASVASAAIFDVSTPVPFSRKQVVLGQLRDLHGTVRYLAADHPDNQLRERVLVVSVVLPFLAQSSEFEREIKPSLPASSETHQRTSRSFTGMSVLPSGDGQVQFALDFVERTDFHVPQIKASNEAIIGAVVGGAPGAAIGALIGKKKGKKTAVTMAATSLAKGSVRFTLQLSPQPVRGKDVAVTIKYEFTKDCSGFGANIKSCEREVDDAVLKAKKPVCRGFELPPLPEPSFSLMQSKFDYRHGSPSLELTYSLPGWKGALAPYVLAVRGVPAAEAPKGGSGASPTKGEDAACASISAGK